jgi:molybdenum cofactor cytidylyltransferase
MTGSGHIAAMVLAAGRSTRMGAANKLLADVGGKPMVRHATEAALASQARPVIVVTGHQADEVRAALAGLGVAFVANPDFATGLSTSLKAGIRALPKETAGALVVLGDMPLVLSSHIDRIIETFERSSHAAIVVPVHQGRRGNPVLWPADLLPELLRLDGDTGARRLLGTYADRVVEVDLATHAIEIDVDTPEALRDISTRD